jgi:hypothetical protein
VDDLEGFGGTSYNGTTLKNFHALYSIKMGVMNVYCSRDKSRASPLSSEGFLE